MKSIIILFIFIISLYSQDIDADLLKKAKAFEKNNNYKEAMQIYKQIALKQYPKQEDFSIKKEEKVSNIEPNKFEKIKKRFYRKHIKRTGDKQTANTLEQMIISDFGLYPYKTNYLLPVTYDTKQREGRDQYETKFQFSIEKPLFYNVFGLNETISFGYTQTSYWQTSEDSAPFRETNYEPEVFVTIPYGNKQSSLKAYKISLLHQSNGQDKEDSRSWNRIYLESYFQYTNLFFVPRIWYRIPESKNSDDNKDIEKYLGYGDITLIYPYKKHTFELKLRNNLRLNEDNKGSAEFNWSFPLPSFLSFANTFGYLQVFTGYGNSLIDYDKHMNKIGIGIAFSR
ncbi:phospholipase [Malaciobacter molluscorum]|uniref:phospholipase A n=1 Tax=Malaciobacter molluscorum TaxID=1032072 RepID=UPI00100ACF5A|nr:phospholipase A [Malaciobacter molluscorum]RXJ96158.1 phospholipase [Malaciobacter molluscorum]